ncbi:transposable element Tcb1 transposase [Trichonephila clavipes]|nr:transposable element Tcb1 transposase [Trichonephila clavipes]
MITNLFIPELNNHDVQELWLQQDGATSHTARATIDLLKDTFGDSLISRFRPVNWPPRSCDLTPLDYFPWGYVKSLVYADKPQTLDHLEDNIRRVIADIRPQMLEKVIENWTSKLDYIRASRGSHMPEIIFKMPVRCVPLTATHKRLRLTWSREHALWTPQQWSCVTFSDESKFSLQSYSRGTLIWRAPGTRYHQENTIERHRYGGVGWRVWGGIILETRTDLHVQSVTMTGHIYRNVILEQHVRLFWGAMGAEFLFMDDNTHPHRANIVEECLQSEDIPRMDGPAAYSPDLNLIEHV